MGMVWIWDRRLRNALREATSETHARLDEAVGHLPLSSADKYAFFLTAQYRARLAVDEAFEKQAPHGMVAPPSQTRLLELDLKDLGSSPTQQCGKLGFDTEFEALGAAWVIAGSSLGNRAILHQRRKRELAGPQRFLEDDRLTSYFSDLRTVLTEIHAATHVDEAVLGATKTFEVFERAFAIKRSGVAE